MSRKGAVMSALLVAPSSALAAEQLPAFGPIVLPLLLVLGVIAACAWLLRRTPLVRRGGSGLVVKDSLPLGAKDRLVVVRFDERELLIGISSSGMTLLGQRDGVLESAEDGAENERGRSFLELMGQRQ